MLYPEINNSLWYFPFVVKCAYLCIYIEMHMDVYTILSAIIVWVSLANTIAVKMLFSWDNGPIKLNYTVDYMLGTY